MYVRGRSLTFSTEDVKLLWICRNNYATEWHGYTFPHRQQLSWMRLAVVPYRKPAEVVYNWRNNTVAASMSDDVLYLLETTSANSIFVWRPYTTVAETDIVVGCRRLWSSVRISKCSLYQVLLRFLSFSSKRVSRSRYSSLYCLFKLQLKRSKMWTIFPLKFLSTKTWTLFCFRQQPDLIVSIFDHELSNHISLLILLFSVFRQRSSKKYKAPLFQIRSPSNSSRKYASINGVGFLLWHHTFKMAAMTSLQQRADAAAYECVWRHWLAVCATVVLFYSSWSILSIVY